MYAITRFFNVALRLAAFTAAADALQSAWTSIRSYWQDNFTKDDAAAETIHLSIESSTVAINILRLGGLSFAYALYKRGGISTEVFTRAALLAAAISSTAPLPSTDKIEKLRLALGNGISAAFADQRSEKVLLGLVIRELELHHIVDFYA